MKVLIDAFKKASEQLNSLQNEILNSDSYFDLKKEMDVLQKKMDTMLEPIAQKGKELTIAQMQLLQWAVDNNQLETSKYRVDFRERKEVNKEKLFSLLGDVDTFVTISSITQKDLKEYAKEHKDVRASLEGCIEVVERTPISVTLF